MKVIFCDFDGVLNSWAEASYHSYVRETHPWKWFKHNFLYYSLCWLNDNIAKGTELYHEINLWLLNHVSDHEYFCPIACSNLRYILKMCPDVKIVISSGWRIYGEKCIKRVFKKNGLPYDRVIGMTPTEYGVDEEEMVQPEKGGNCTRGCQIQAWLNWHRGLVMSQNIAHQITGRCEKLEHVTMFKILDDQTDMGRLRGHLVLTDEYSGLTLRQAEAIVAYFKSDYKPERAI